MRFGTLLQKGFVFFCLGHQLAAAYTCGDVTEAARIGGFLRLEAEARTQQIALAREFGELVDRYSNGERLLEGVLVFKNGERKVIQFTRGSGINIEGIGYFAVDSIVNNKVSAHRWPGASDLDQVRFSITVSFKQARSGALTGSAVMKRGEDTFNGSLGQTRPVGDRTPASLTVDEAEVIF